MKKNKYLRLCSLIFLCCIFSIPELMSQNSKLDSLIYSKNLQLLDGTIPMWYSGQYENRSRASQSLLENIISHYSCDNKKLYQFKLAVIDSAQWSGFSMPYGFFFISKGWIIIPADLNFAKFSKLWGYYPFRDDLKSNLSKFSNDPEMLLTNVLYNFVICHELGHYYTKHILNASTYDRWSNEWIASYFATDCLYTLDKSLIAAFNVFTSTFIKEFTPKHRSITDFNEKYTSVGLQNYVWYHCMFQPMIEDIYSAYKNDFLNLFAAKFPQRKNTKNITHKEYLKILDKLTEGKTTKWIKIMEGSINLNQK